MRRYFQAALNKGLAANEVGLAVTSDQKKEPMRGESLTDTQSVRLADARAEEEPANEAAASQAPTAGRARVLVVDDERSILRALRKVLAQEDYEVITLDAPLGAVELLREQEVDVLLCDLRMPHMSGVELLLKAKELRPRIEVVIMTAFATVETALAAVKAGAFDYLTKPFENIDKVIFTVDKALERKRLVDRTLLLEQQLKSKDGFPDIVGSSPLMQAVFSLVESVAPTSANVLIQGETGTGKELVARAIHDRSERSHEPFVPINCSALSESLLESELFGHKKGSFTGATHDKKGLFESAHRGTLFLDELGDMATQTQVKLLRVLQEGEVRPIGATETIKVDVRVVAATHVNLEEAMKTGAFREDLFYRLNVINIQLPPLRERPEDIPLLSSTFLRRSSKRFGREVESISADCLNALMHHRWVGNVRELENVIERSVVLAKDATLQLEDLPPNVAEAAGMTVHSGAHPAAPSSSDEPAFLSMTFREAKDAAVSSFERRYVEHILTQNNGNVSGAARAAGLDRSNFRRILQKHNITPEAFKREE